MSLSKISKTNNLDVTTVVRGKDQDGSVHVEASITMFSPRTKELDSSVLKKITVGAMDKTFEKAQDKALEKAVELLGL
jgi:hypothetical protein